MTGDETGAFAVVGLGQIGGNLCRQALQKGFDVVGVDPGGIDDDLVGMGLRPGDSLEAVADQPSRPRTVLLYVPAGPLVDEVLDDLAGILDAGDIVADGGNSYWGDSVRRHARMAEKGLRFVDVGTSGGLSGARRGACFMVGGEAGAVTHIEPILRALAVDGGYVHAGGPGSGHFVKLVHNGIEFGMLQAIAEGVDLLERHQTDLPVADVLECWRHGTVIRSWLVDLMAEQYRERDGLDDVPAYVEDTGEVNWLVEDAMAMEVPVPVITQAVMKLLASRDGRQHWARAIAMMRHGFGGHPFGPDEHIAEERRKGRVGPRPE